ncbi:MAG: dihydrolipoamide acetyltransferase family protein [Novosphingobium sp.]
MLNELKIPRMGSVENAKMVVWHVAEGDSYAQGDLLYEIETDKTTTEVDALAPGILARRLAEPGDEFKVGDRVGLWAEPGMNAGQLRAELAAIGGDATQAAGAEPEPQPVAAPPAAAPVRPLSLEAAGGRRISPLARRLAAQHGVDVTRLAGSGAAGKITGKDVLAAAESVADEPAAVATAPAPVARAMTAPEPPPAIASPPPSLDGAEVVPHSLRRKTIARRLSEAAAIPALTADMEVDLGALLAHRKTADGQGVSVLGLIAHAAVAALLEHPRLNAHWRDDAVLVWKDVHLGVAVDTPDGLVVPVIRHAERLNPRGLTAEIARLGQVARDGALRPADMEGGTFTLSNPGSLGPVIRAEALLNPPQVALLGLPGIVRVARALPHGDGWAMGIRQVIRPSLTFDHRALDGGPVIQFLNTLKARLESL